MITIILILSLSRVAVRVQLVDVPDARKLHGRPVPVVGGIAMAIGAIVPVVYLQNRDNFVIAWILGSLTLVAFGIVDDLRGMSPRAKFVGQIAAALVVILYGGIKITSLGMLLPDDVLIPNWLAMPLTLVAIVGVTNAINLADGLDGLAGGISLLDISAPSATWPTWKATLPSALSRLPWAVPYSVFSSSTPFRQRFLWAIREASSSVFRPLRFPWT